METTQHPSRAGLWAYVLFTCLLFFNTAAFSQAPLPIITARFANPTYDCATQQYCVDVEFITDSVGLEVFGINLRFFYPDDILELVGFTDYQGGYGPISPDPPTVVMVAGAPFGLTGQADFVNGAVQLLDLDTTALPLDDVIWTKLFSICFTIDSSGTDIDSFCPPIIFDLEQDPANGGYFVGDDGVVITRLDTVTMDSDPVTENVDQFNWMYNNTPPPFGTTIEEVCISLACAPVLTCAPDITINCDESTDPANTGFTTATDTCDGDIVISFTDSIDVSFVGCPQELIIIRTWIATNDCGLADTCVQMITVLDDIGPVIVCPIDLTLDCTASTDILFTGSATATDACDPVPIVDFSDITVAGACPQAYTIMRTFTATDACLNSSTCTQTITVQDITAPVITCPVNFTLECSDTLTAELATAVDNCSDTDSLVIGFTDVVCDNPIMGFTGPYDFANWTTVIPMQGGSVTTMGNSEVMLVGPDSLTCTNASTMFVIIITASGQIVFDWNYTSIDTDGPFFDPFGYSVNGTFFQLTSNAGPNVQNGTATVVVTAGDVFAFEQRSFDCLFGEGATTVVEFFACVDQPPVPGICTQLVVRTHTAVDECGNVGSCVQTLFIEDTTPPDLICPADTIIALLADTSPASTGMATATDNCALIVLVSFTDSITLSTCDSSFIIQRTWIASDGCTNFATCIQEIQVTDADSVIIIEEDPIACLDEINLSIDNDCGTVLLSGMILTGEQAGNNSFTVIIKDLNGNIIPNATFTYEHVGQTFTVMILNECTGQSCWGYVNVEDKLGPLIDCVCPAEPINGVCAITCLQVDSFLNGQIPLALQPTVIDNCGNATIEIVNIQLSFETCSGGFILVTWLATDAFGNTSTCEQEFIIVPLTLETLVFPPDFIGECNTSSDPSVTGWPQVNGNNLTNIPGHCNIIATYTDMVIQLCGGGIKIIRTWTVFDWCVPVVREFVQVIILMDRTGPVLTCPPDLTIGTSVWYCSADVIVPMPIAVDACSDVTTFQLLSEEGIVFPIGNIFRVNGLELGTHTFVWTVTDECFNTSTCAFDITIIDNVPPVLACKQHLIVGLTDDRPNGITLVDAESFDDGSFDNCSPVSFRARRMDSCIDFNWTTGGACVDDIPGGIPPVNGADAGTVHGICVPFACCDVGAGPIMIELEVTDAAGNVNYCMVEVEVQDKLDPSVICPPDITVSCEFIFEPVQAVFPDLNNDGSLEEDPLSAIFGNMFDAHRHDESERSPIIINDPNGNVFPQPFNWGIDGWADDNCELNLQVVVSIYEDCSAAGLPGDPPQGAVKLITRRFIATDGSGNQGQCLQRIWVVDNDPFFITDTTCNNANTSDGVIWPCDVEFSFCPDDLTGTGEPMIFEDHCSIIGVTFNDTRYDFADGSCYKILREWSILDWCQFDAETGAGIWTYVQVIKVVDSSGPDFLECPQGLVELCLDDEGISLPANNQTNLGENHPDASSCSVHVALTQRVRELCSESVIYDVKLYPFNGSEFIQIKPTTVLQLDANHEGDLSFNTQQSSMQSISEDGLPYNDPLCGDFHRLVWTVTDGCGNQSSCDYIFRLEDCKDPSPVCLNGISSAIMSDEGQVTIWASDFNASSFDDCTPAEELLYSFSGTIYQPSFTYTCENVPVIGDSIDVEIWVADAGSDQNCNGTVEWSERNKDFCITYIIIDDPNNVCDEDGLVLEGEIMTEYDAAVSKVTVNLTGPQGSMPVVITSTNGKFSFADVPQGEDYTITTERDDDHKNGVSTLDLVSIQKHLLGKQPFTSPYQYIAADANNSSSISAIDLIEIRKVILGLQSTFTSNKSWRFVKKDSGMVPGNPWPFDESIEIDNLTMQQVNDLDFVGVKIGDVNNTVIANALQILPRESRRVMKVNALSKGELKVHDIIEVRFVLPEITSGFQWTLETKGLEFVSVKSRDIPIEEANVGVPKKDMLTMSWNGDPFNADYNKQELSFVVQFRVQETGLLHEMLSITSSVTEAEAYTLSGEILDVALEFDNSKSFTEFALYQNQPNPWNEQTLIGFDLPEDAISTLTVYDVAGKIVKTITGSYKEGYNAILLTSRELPGSGILYYRLESGEYSATKKMMIIR